MVWYIARLHAALPWLVLVAGGVLLAVRRRRCPRAVGFALPAVAVLAGFEGAYTASVLGNGWPAKWVGELWEVGYPWAVAVGCLLLAVAARADRPPEAGR